MGAMKEVFMERCEAWARSLDRYGLRATDEEVAAEIWRSPDKGQYSFAWELENESFTDTEAREAMAEAISTSRIGMTIPSYGDSEQYKQEYHEKMSEWIERNDLSL